jgi:DnaJ family protein B protein 12
VVARAFQILSDSDKRARYDKFGGDPDNRFGASSSSGQSPFSGFARTPGGSAQQGPTWAEEEISPEELFNRFFSGGMGGPFGPFGMVDFLVHYLTDFGFRGRSV